MAQAARERGVAPEQLADEMSSLFKAMDERLEISFDRFIRTTEPAHHSPSQAIWRAMAEKGDIYLGRYEGWYSVRDEAYYDEKELHTAETGEKLSPQGTLAMDGRGELVLPPLRLPGQAPRVLRGPSGLHPPGGAAQRGDALRRGRAFRSFHLAHQLRMGREGTRQPEPRHVRLARRAYQLPHRRRISTPIRGLPGSGRPICTSSARTWCASTPFTGRPS